MHAFLTEIHYVELAELNMSQFNIIFILIRRVLITYICVKIKDVTKELRKNTLKISLSRQLFFSI